MGCLWGDLCDPGFRTKKSVLWLLMTLRPWLNCRSLRGRGIALKMRLDIKFHLFRMFHKFLLRPL